MKTKLEFFGVLSDSLRRQLGRRDAKLETCRWRCASQCFEVAPNQSGNRTFADVLEAAVSRRTFLKGTAAAGGLMVVSPLGTAFAQDAVMDGSIGFSPVVPNTLDELVVPEGYTSNIVIRWGDPIFADAPAFDRMNQTAEAQAQQFGYNNDFVAYMPFPLGSDDPNRALLVVNHEYTNPEQMHPDYDGDNPTAEQIKIEMMAHGLSVVEVLREHDGSWTYVQAGANNRRITPETPMILTGPVAGHDLVKTSADNEGLTVMGTLNNCAGGVTPWGTILTAEENFHQYFENRDLMTDTNLQTLHARYGLPEGESRRWSRVDTRFDLAVEPNEPNRFGWIIEIDPYDPTSTPKKHTALGRFKHEGATTSLTDDGHVVAYMGDDERFDYMYKFVSDGVYVPGDRAHNMTLLESGTLYVARLDDDGNGEWLPLVYGQGPLNEENGFTSQADVLVRTRQAADLLGATKMDRPEDVERNPVTGVVYAAMTNNTRREAEQVDAANPRANNRYGHVIELHETNNDANATTFNWNIFMLCGDPNDPETETYFGGFDPQQVSPIAAPDNLAFDRAGNLWIATDGQPGTLQHNDGFFAVPVKGEERGFVRMFLSVPAGAEACGPSFNSDETSMFVAVQHPGEGGNFENPGSHWPDNDGNGSKPSVAAIYRTDLGRIGS